MTTAVTGAFDAVKDHNGANIRKVLQMAVLLQPWEGTTPLASLTNTTNEVVIPDGFLSVGVLSKEAALTSTPALTVNAVPGYGYGQALRRDISARDITVSWTMIESRRRAFEVYYGVDLSASTSPTGRTPCTGACWRSVPTVMGRTRSTSPTTTRR
jgi:hypothetical protein